MSELNTMSFEELKAQAQVLGLNFAHNISEEKLREKLKIEIGEVDEAPAAPVESKASDKVRIIIEESETDELPVPVGLNGVIYAIQRGKEVSVPQGVVDILNHAVMKKYNPKTMEHRSVLRYPFRIVG